MKKTAVTVCALVALWGVSVPADAQDRELIQMAILLDTSSSMDGLIDQAKTNLWKIVNETARAKKSGKTPMLEVAVYEYGNDGIPQGEGYIRMVTPLTGDLDLVSEKLFSLTTNGGSEYCGQVIKAAAASLLWSKRNDIYKVIYIAGNEPFSQGPVAYADACKSAVGKGIIVNTIFCGGKSDSDAAGWKDGASRADGSFMSIDQNIRNADIVAPQDKEILSLNASLNKTYIGYGSAGSSRKVMQAEQDSNSMKMANEAAVQRTLAKSAPSYSNSGWDLVDAQKQDSKAVDSLKEDDLPAEMKGMSKAEQKSYIEKKSRERDAIRSKIKALSEQREKYVAETMKKNSGDNTLDEAIVKSIRSQAAKKGYSFE